METNGETISMSRSSTAPSIGRSKMETNGETINMSRSSTAPTHHGVQVFRLLDLPPELWAKIGRCTVDAHPKWHLTLGISDSEDPALQQPTITRTCKCLRAELLPYYYAISLLHWYYWADILLHRCRDRNNRLDWLIAIGTQDRRHLKHVYLVAEPLELEASRKKLEQAYGICFTVGEFIARDPRPAPAIANRIRTELVYPLIFTS